MSTFTSLLIIQLYKTIVGTKKNPAKLLDRDKTKNKHYEQTLFLSHFGRGSAC